MIKKFLIALGGFILVVAALAVVKAAQVKELMAQNHAMPAASVSTIEAKSVRWTPVLHTIGTLNAVRGVSLAAESQGTLIKINFENGALVKEGDILFEIDSSVERAQLRAAVAQRDLAQINKTRAVELREKQTNSQAEVDQAEGTLAQAEANVAAIEATIAKKTIRAPFNGRVGLRSVNLGQYINPGMPLVQIQDLSELFVNFNIPQRQIGSLTVGQNVTFTIDAFPDRTFNAKLIALESAVDATTRNIGAQGLVENQDETLRPGMFAKVVVELPEGQPAIVVPATAVAYAAYGNSVYIVENMKDKDGKEYVGVRQQFVTIGDRRGDQLSITSGVKEGEQVVSAGVFKLRNALPVQINNEVQPTNDPAPKPTNS